MPPHRPELFRKIIGVVDPVVAPGPFSAAPEAAQDDEGFRDFTQLAASGRRKVSPRIACGLARVEETGR